MTSTVHLITTLCSKLSRFHWYKKCAVKKSGTFLMAHGVQCNKQTLTLYQRCTSGRKDVVVLLAQEFIGGTTTRKNQASR